jgi:hypothetical protein
MNDFEVRDLYDQVQRLEGQVQYLIEALLCCDDVCKSEESEEE